MPKIGLVGSGKIGSTIAKFLSTSGDYQVTLFDIRQSQLDQIPDKPTISKRCLDVTDVDLMAEELTGHFAVISAATYRETIPVAQAAFRASVHYLDLTEDVASARTIGALAEKSNSAFIPQCGLAPGFVSVVANDIANRFDTLDTMSLRVGALPEFPTNSLNYNLTWSTEGVINEYCAPCVAIVDHELTELRPMEQREEFSVDGVTYESFNTSGGLGTLGETLQGKVRNLKYQTIRYPGHCAIMKTLLQDLRLADRREVLKDVLENAVPTTLQDVVLVFVSVSGFKNGQLIQESYVNKIYGHVIGDEQLSAIQITTASGVCTVLDLLVAGNLPNSGLVRQEQVRLNDFLANRFGHYYCDHLLHSHAV